MAFKPQLHPTHAAESMSKHDKRGSPFAQTTMISEKRQLGKKTPVVALIQQTSATNV